MKNEEFLRLCKAKVAEYTNSHMDKTDGKQITVQDVYVVWSCKTLQNSKALIFFSLQRQHRPNQVMVAPLDLIGVKQNHRIPQDLPVHYISSIRL